MVSSARMLRGRNQSGFHHLIGGVVFQPCYEEYPAAGPLSEQRVVGIAPVDGHNLAGVEMQGLGHADIACLGFGDQNVGRQVVVVIQQHMRLHASLWLGETWPRGTSPGTARWWWNPATEVCS